MPSSTQLGGSGESCGGSLAISPDGGNGPQSMLICRVRPCDKPSPLVSVHERQAQVEVCPEKDHPGEPLRFDKVQAAPRGVTTDQQEEFFELFKPAVLACFYKGTSSSVVTYGGQQSGKSFALSGFFMHPQQHGVVPRVIQLICELLSAAGQNPVPVIEASFFDIQGDIASDLLSQHYPKITLREASQPPFLLLDPHLTTQRCSNQHQLMDTYFLGLEHRSEHKSKGAHTCFQIAFVHPDGHKSYVRFIEMAWSWSSSKSSGSTLNAPGGGRNPLQQPLGSAQCTPCSVLDQVVQCKLTGAGTAPYKNSLLALLLKPCFEGSSLLYFIYCLRLEQTQLSCLAMAAPLLAKLHLWLGRARGGTPAAAAAAMLGGAASATPLRTTAPVVPPLRLNNGASTSDPALVAMQADNGSPGSTSCSESFGGSPTASLNLNSNVGVTDGATTVEATPPLPAKNEQLVQQPVHNAQHHDKPQSHKRDAPPQRGLHAIHRCVEVLQVKQRAAEILREDAMRSEAALHDLVIDIQELHRVREARGDHGPSQQETTLKMIYEKLQRSMRITCDQLNRIEEDIDALVRLYDAFGQGDAVPPVYDSYNVREEDVQQMVAHAAAAMNNQIPMQHPARNEVVVLGSNSVSSVPGHESAPMPMMPQHGGQKLSASTPALPVAAPIVVPQLPLSQLPQEPVCHNATDHGADGKGDVPSPSSSSAPSSRDPSFIARRELISPTPAPPVGLVAGPSFNQAAWSAMTVPNQAIGLGPTMFMPPQSTVSATGGQFTMPRTPPQPAAGIHGKLFAGASLSTVGGGSQHGSPPVPLQRSVGGTAQEAEVEAATIAAMQAGGGGSLEARLPQRPGMPRSPDLRQQAGLGAWRLSPGTPGLGVGGSITTMVGTRPVNEVVGLAPSADQWGEQHGGRLRKSHSTASLRSGSTAAAAGPPPAAVQSGIGSPAPPALALRSGVHPPGASPLLGHRGDRDAGASPMRCSASRSASSLPGVGSSSPCPPMPQKRAVTAMVSRPGSLATGANTRQPGPRAATPASRVASAATPVLAEQRVRGSPTLPSRQVSGQAFPLRTAVGGKVTQDRLQRSASKQPSPERQRSAAPVSISLSPMRGSCVGAASAQVPPARTVLGHAAAAAAAGAPWPTSTGGSAAVALGGPIPSCNASQRLASPSPRGSGAWPPNR